MPAHNPLRLTMTRERAQQILDHRRSSFGAGLGPMTEDERDQVNRLWDTMPGNTCFTDALLRIAKGTALSAEGAA